MSVVHLLRLVKFMTGSSTKTPRQNNIAFHFLPAMNGTVLTVKCILKPRRLTCPSTKPTTSLLLTRTSTRIGGMVVKSMAPLKPTQLHYVLVLPTVSFASTSKSLLLSFPVTQMEFHRPDSTQIGGLDLRFSTLCLSSSTTPSVTLYTLPIPNGRLRSFSTPLASSTAHSWPRSTPQNGRPQSSHIPLSKSA